MQLTKTNLKNTFMVIIDANTQDSNTDIHKQSEFSINDFEKILALLTIIQDMYNKKEEIEIDMLDIGLDLDGCFKKYFENYSDLDIQNIDDLKFDQIMDQIYDILPKSPIYGNIYPREINEIKIFKEDSLYKMLDQSQNDIKEAQSFIISLLK